MDDATRFRKSSSAGAYLGLTPRRHQSGDVSWTGRISKTGDGLARALLYEAANSLMVRVKASPPLKVWGLELAKRVGARKARLALARKLGENHLAQLVTKVVKFCIADSFTKVPVSDSADPVPAIAEGIAPGQACVFYDGERVLGGGWIAQTGLDQAAWRSSDLAGRLNEIQRA